MKNTTTATNAPVAKQTAHTPAPAQSVATSQGTPTPGPWTALLSSGDEPWMVAAAMPVARIPNYDDRAAANARLIAAAPELLAALKAMHACHRGFSGNENWTTLDDDARTFAESAIAKAKGGAQ